MTRNPHFARNATATILFLVACFGIFLYWLSLSGTSVAPRSSYRIRVVVPSAISLAQHGDVRQAGVKIGAVDRIAARGRTAVLDLAIDEKYAPAYRDARVLVRGKDLLGENYVDLDPGSPSAGRVPDGGVVPIERAPESTQLDEILSTLDARRRRDLQRILDVLGEGLGSRGKELNRFFAGSAGVLRASRPVNATVAADRAQVAAFVDDFGRVMRSLGDRATEIRVLARDGRSLATAVAARDRGLRATLAALPGFLTQARSTVGHLGRFSGGATPVMRDLRLATGQLAPAMAQLRPAADATRATMRALGGFARQASPMASRLKAFSAATTQLPSPLEAFLRQANPLLAYLAPYARELATTATAMRSSAESYDALGHYGRAGLVLTKSTPVGAFTPAQDTALKALLKAGGLSKAADTRGYNPYPKPGGLAHLQSFNGSYPRLLAERPYRRRGR